MIRRLLAWWFDTPWLSPIGWLLVGGLFDRASTSQDWLSMLLIVAIVALSAGCAYLQERVECDDHDVLGTTN